MGSARAMTSRLFAALTCPSGGNMRNSAPVITVPPCMMPDSAAIARAVSGLSPVTIRTLMPACWHVATDSGIFSLRWSRMPTKPSQVRLVS
jgi:hypothetical protein